MEVATQPDLPGAPEDGTASRDDAALAAEFGMVVARLYTFLRRTILPEEMGLSQALALGTLRDAGPLRITELALLEGVRQPTCTGLVNRMEEEGWVARELDSEDRRAVVVALTDKGREVLRSITDARSAVLEQYLGILSSAEREALARALPGLRRLAEAGVDATKSQA